MIEGVPASVRTVVVFGGAFDPPHAAHVDLPLAARDAAGADWLLVIPASAPPLKDGPAASGSDRLAMTRLAFEGRERVSVSPVELERGGASYTIDTVEALRSALPAQVTLRLCIGADQARQFHKWRDAQRLLSLAEPLVMLRPPLDDEGSLLAEIGRHWPPEESAQWAARLARVPVVDVSSTEVRRLLREQGPDAPGLADMVPGAVLAHIREHGLYRE